MCKWRSRPHFQIRFCMHQIQYRRGEIWFSINQMWFFWNNDDGKNTHIDWSVTNWCLMGRWCLHGQCGRDFSWRARSDPTQIWTSAGADEGLLARGQERRQRERITRGFCAWLRPLWPILGQWHICASQADIYHPRQNRAKKSEVLENWMAANNGANLAFLAAHRHTCFGALMEGHLKWCTGEPGRLCLDRRRRGEGVESGPNWIQMLSHFLIFFCPSTHHSLSFPFSGWSMASLLPRFGLSQDKHEKIESRPWQQRKVSKITAKLRINQRIISQFVEAFTPTVRFRP